MKRILLAPITACILIAVINFIFGEGFQGGLWILAAFIFSVTLLPIVFNMDDKNVPILQIFSSLAFFIAFFAIAAFLDFKEGGFLLERALLYGLGIGFGTAGAVMLIKSLVKE